MAEEVTLNTEPDSALAARLRELLQRAAEDATELRRRGWKAEIHIALLDGVFMANGERLVCKYSPMIKITREVSL